MTIGEIKRSALEAYKKNFAKVAAVQAIYIIISTVAIYFIQVMFKRQGITDFSNIQEIISYYQTIASVCLGLIILAIVEIPFVVGFKGFFVKTMRGEEPDIGSIFKYYINHPINIFLAKLLQGLIMSAIAFVIVIAFGFFVTITAVMAFDGGSAFIWGFISIIAYILFFVIGFIILLRFSFLDYVLSDEPSEGAYSSISRGLFYTKKNVGRIFILNISFIGWYILLFAIAAVLSAVQINSGANIVVFILCEIISIVCGTLLSGYISLALAKLYLVIKEEKLPSPTKGLFDSPEETSEGSEEKTEKIDEAFSEEK